MSVTSPPSSRLPVAGLSRPGRSHDGLSAGQRRVVIGAIAVGHVVGLWGVMQVPAVREAVQEAAPMFVDLLAPPPKPAPEPPPPPVVKAPPPRVIAAPPKPADTPAPFTVEAPPPEPVAAAPTPVQPEPAPAPPAPPAPVIIPTSAIQFLETPLPPEYPRVSKRLNETGTVMLQVHIDERGNPAQVVVKRSSNFPRLDEAAVLAVRRWRFRPHLVNDRPTAGWATIPVIFELEK
jgi:periplasmic protein TonB